MTMTVLVHLMADKLQMGYFCSGLNQSPYILPIGLIDVIIYCFQVQAVHLKGVRDLHFDAFVNCSTEILKDDKILTKLVINYNI